MSDWKTKTLGEVTSYIAKGIPPKYVEEVNDDTICVLNQKCNRNFRISYADSRLHNNAAKKVPDVKMLKPGDVLINSTGTGTAGRVAQIWDIEAPTTIDGHMILMRPTDEIDPLYYGYAVNAFQAAIESYAEGSTGQTEINKTRLQNETIIMYPVDKGEQYKIARILAAIDEKILLNEEVNKNLLQQAQALFEERFLSYDNLPIGWKRMALGDVSDMSAGGDKPKNISDQRTEAYQYPIYSNGISNDGLYGFTTDYKISAESVTVSARGTIGFVCLRHIPFTPIVRLITLVPHSSIISAKYLYLWLKSIPIYGTGTTQQQLTVPDFRKTEILIPSEADMREFSETVDPLFQQVWANQEENEKLADVRDALLPHLMSGELDVSDIDF